MNKENFNIIIDKLDSFIRKFYKSQLIKGFLLTLTFLLTYFLLIGILEYFSYFNTILRTIIFYSFLLFSLFNIIYFILIPLLKLFKLGKIISYTQCSEIINIHFPEIKDKLINIIELQKNLTQVEKNRELIVASINQKSNSLKFINFSKAIDIYKNKKYIKPLLLSILILFFIIIFSPDLIPESTNRILHYQTVYEKPNPFIFIILNNKLEAIQQEDYQLNIKIVGNKIPDKAFIQIGSSTYPLEKHSNILYSFLFKQINAPITFQLVAEDYKTKVYTINLIKKPIIVDFSVFLAYPKYTGKKEEKFSNIGDLVVPEGTKISWFFKTLNTKDLLITFNDKPFTKISKINENFIYTNSFYSNTFYSIKSKNENIINNDSLNYLINVVKDQYPQLEVTQFQDSINKFAYYISGNIKDDYGFKKLIFNYHFLNNRDSIKNSQTIYIPISKSKTQDNFNFFIDFKFLNFKPGDKIEYYFEIFDNDEVNGSKSTKSKINSIEIPSIEQINQITENKNNDIKNTLKDKIEELNNIESKIEQFNKQILAKEKLTWLEKKELSDLLKQQNILNNDISKLSEENLEKNNLENQFNNPDTELLEKQKLLQKLFNEVINEDTKKLYEELQKLIDNIDKNRIQDMIDKLKLSNKDMKDQLDRNLELFRQLEFDYKLNNIINKIDELKKSQDSLSKVTDNSSKNKMAKLFQEQENIKKEFDNISNEIKKIDSLNKQLENPRDLLNTEKNENEIKNDLNNSSNSIKNNDKKNAIKYQKQVTQKLDDLQNKLSEMSENQEQEQNEEDINNLRQILENLIQLSFNQEDLINKTKIINVNDPKFIDLMQNQHKIIDNLKLVEDSLFALSKRQIQIQTIVNKEINKINLSESNVLDFFKQRNISNILINQQLAMTSINNLALLLAESLNQMKNQNNQNSNSKSNKKGSACQKPGSGKPNIESIRKLQQQLNKEINDLKEGNISKTGKSNMNENLAKIAAQQQFLRNQLNQLQSQMQKEGSGINPKELKKINDMMEQSETDLVNKILSNQLIERQKEIETRLLESEKSLKEKDFENKRQSNEAKNLIFSNKIQKLEYNSNKLNEKEILKTNNLQYQFFYKNKINEYFNKFNQ